MKKIFSCLLLLMALLLCTSACAGQNRAEPGELRLVSLYGMESMDMAQTMDEYMGILNVFDRLFEVKMAEDGTSEIVPSLCESYEISDDGKTFIFRLREGIVFSNGSALTAHDVAYSFTRLLILDNCNTEVASGIAGAEAVLNGETENLSGIRVLDDRTVEITLDAPNAGFLADLATAGMSIVDRETTEGAEGFGTVCQDTVGTGPYVLSEWVIGDHYTFTYNEKYWGEKPSVLKCTVKIVPEEATQDFMFRKGETDLFCLNCLDISLIRDTYLTDYADRTIRAPELGVHYFALNEKNPALSDVRVRKAIQKAINVDDITTYVLGDMAQHEHGLIPYGVWGHNEDIRSSVYDPESARALLREGGYADGDIRFELAFDASDEDLYRVIAEMIRQNLEDVGIIVTVRDYEESAWYDKRVSGEMDSYLSVWIMDSDHPGNVMASLFGSEKISRARSMNYGNVEVMDGIIKAASILDDDARKAEYQDLEKKIIVEDAALVPLYESQVMYALGDRVADMKPYWSGYENAFYIKDVVLK